MFSFLETKMHQTHDIFMVTIYHQLKCVFFYLNSKTHFKVQMNSGLNYLPSYFLPENKLVKIQVLTGEMMFLNWLISLIWFLEKLKIVRFLNTRHFRNLLVKLNLKICDLNFLNQNSLIFTSFKGTFGNVRRTQRPRVEFF
jgi:hypothetical protein